jgi:uncharacterized Zn finger protein (UPF0148 family)
MVKVHCKICGKLVFESKGTKPVFGNFICVSCDSKERGLKKAKIAAGK